MSEGFTLPTIRFHPPAPAVAKATLTGKGVTCPVVMVHRAGATLVDNVFTAGGSADGIRATGALLNVQRNTWNLNAVGAVIQILTLAPLALNNTDHWRSSQTTNGMESQVPTM